jgi:hypothetical protein
VKTESGTVIRRTSRYSAEGVKHDLDLITSGDEVMQTMLSHLDSHMLSKRASALAKPHPLFQKKLS